MRNAKIIFLIFILIVGLCIQACNLSFAGDSVEGINNWNKDVNERTAAFFAGNPSKEQIQEFYADPENQCEGPPSKPTAKPYRPELGPPPAGGSNQATQPPPSGPAIEMPGPQTESLRVASAADLRRLIAEAEKELADPNGRYSSSEKIRDVVQKNLEKFRARLAEMEKSGTG